jgi:hypothetical protein
MDVITYLYKVILRPACSHILHQLACIHHATAHRHAHCLAGAWAHLQAQAGLFRAFQAAYRFQAKMRQLLQARQNSHKHSDVVMAKLEQLSCWCMGPLASSGWPPLCLSGRALLPGSGAAAPAAVEHSSKLCDVVTNIQRCLAGLRAHLQAQAGLFRDFQAAHCFQAHNLSV